MKNAILKQVCFYKHKKTPPQTGVAAELLQITTFGYLRILNFRGVNIMFGVAVLENTTAQIQLFITERTWVSEVTSIDRTVIPKMRNRRK
ncbi:hypothetical protein AYY27_00620 [Photobacterium damselae]|nr:hypothetical protein AYY27_00620 [Photobacterium damselae]